MLVHVPHLANMPILIQGWSATWVHRGENILRYWRSEVVNNERILHSCMDRETWIYVGF